MKGLADLLEPLSGSGLTLDSVICEDNSEKTTSALSVEPSRTTASTLQVIPEPIGITNGNLTDSTGCGRSQLFFCVVTNLTLFLSTGFRLYVR